MAIGAHTQSATIHALPIKGRGRFASHSAGEPGDTTVIRFKPARHIDWHASYHAEAIAQEAHHQGE